MIASLMRMAGERADAPFLLFNDQRWSFAATADIALRAATWLDKLGVEAGDRVVLAIGNRPVFVFAWFALLARGAVAVPISPEMFGDPLRYIVNQSESRHLLCEAADHTRFAAETASCGVTIRSFADEAAFVADIERQPSATAVPTHNHTPAAILYTSGTTGQPKGVVIPNRSYLAAGEKVTEAIGITAEDRIMTFLPLHHANPQMYSIMSALTVGCSVAIVPRFSASKFLEQAAHYRATGFTYVGTVLSILAKEWTAPVQSSLRWCVGGGAPRAVWERLNGLLPVRVHELYGMTETGGLVTINARSRYRFGSVGVARDDFDVVALDDDGRVLPPGRTGEIAVRPRQPWVMMSGYFRKPDETLAAMDNLWFHTGDLGRFDDEGFLYFEGRKKELIRRGGEMISPVEIELAALRFPQIADCAAVGVADEILEEDIKLVVVRRDGFDADALLAHLRGALPRHMLPRYLEFVSEIPKTPTQKVQRFRLVRNSAATVDLRGPRVSG